ncbi:MAG: c-type cytochrome [Betaproteobacteria bacterium]|nr:MAG: c-type cytochrome [Betaproteobacteria bacterium]
MTRNVLKATIPAMLAASLQAACTPADEEVSGRWHTESQVQRGRTIFMAHCARCHGNRAQGTRDWRVPDFRGEYPLHR